MSELYVIDAGILFSTWTKKFLTSSFITTPQILEEVLNKASKFRVDTLSLVDRLREESPPLESLNASRQAASITGDLATLSEADIELIALAHAKKREGLNAFLVSTDMAILNTARKLGLSIIDPSGKFKNDIHWIMVCPACNHRSTRPSNGIECPICGTQMKRRVQKKRRVQ